MMASKKSTQAGKPGKGDRLMKEMGIFGNMNASDGDDDDDEQSELEAELLRLEGKTDKPLKKKKAKEAPDVRDIEKMALNIDIDIGSDEELSGDENELLKELEGFSSEGEEEPPAPPALNKSELIALLESRHELYTRALTNCTDATKKRRYERAIKTLQTQLKDAKAGRVVAEDAIPPPVQVEAPPKIKPAAVSADLQPRHLGADAVVSGASHGIPSHSPSTKTASANNTSLSPQKAVSYNDPRTAELVQRRNEYQDAALKAKRSGDELSAKRYLRIRKDFDRVITAIEEGQSVDLTNLPPPPGEKPTSSSTEAAQQGSYLEDVAAPTKEEAKSLFNAPELPTDTLGALQQRFQKYQDSEKEATEQGNSSKARRMGRIVKQYQSAIKAYNSGKAFDYTELPTPPGFADIPLPSSAQKSTASAAGGAAAGAVARTAPVNATATEVSSPTKSAGSLGAPAEAVKRSPTSTSEQPQAKPKSAKRQASLSIQEKQLHMLQERQAQYKKAALEAKKHDDMELARKHMRIIKGMNPMIHAATNGLPVDTSQIPPPPASAHEAGYVIVEAADVADINPEERLAEFTKIVDQLKDQIKRSSDNTIHFKAMGDVKNAFVFENLEQNCRKDLDAVQNALRHNDPVPKYHYETRQYSTIKINTDLGDDDLQIKILKGMQYQLPPEISSTRDLDTQVQYEFPWPQDDVQKGRTEMIKHTDSPDYNHTDKLKIDRRSKGMLRIFKGRKLKFELFHRRGFLKSDRHFSTVNIKLDQLETAATVHDCFDLLDVNGRKPIGGKLEVILRLREPLSQKHVETIKEKWLVIDQFVRVDRPVHQDPPPSQRQGHRGAILPVPPQVSNVKLQSLEVLKYEKKELDEKIRMYSGGQLPPADIKKLSKTSSQLAVQIDGITTMMRQNQLSPREYINVLTQLSTSYVSAIRNSTDRNRQRILTIKKDIIAREIRAWQSKTSSGR